MSSDHLPIPGPLSYTPAWYEARKTCFGASDAAMALGRSRYGTPLDLYAKKKGLVPAEDQTEDQAMGHDLEPGVINCYRRMTGYIVSSQPGMFFHPEHRFIGATPDALAAEDGDCDLSARWGNIPGLRGVNAKTSRALEEFGDEWTDEIPLEYLIQSQQECYVLGVARIDLPVLFGIRNCRIYSVERNDDIIDAIVAAETELWERIQNNDPPPPNFEHPRTSKLLRNLHGVEAGKMIELSPETITAWMEDQRLKDMQSEIERKRETLRNQILHALGDAEIGRFPLGTRELVRKRVHMAEHVRKASTQLRLTERKVK
jgi:predicted phage-related endonuclease